MGRRSPTRRIRNGLPSVALPEESPDRTNFVRRAVGAGLAPARLPRSTQHGRDGTPSLTPRWRDPRRPQRAVGAGLAPARLPRSTTTRAGWDNRPPRHDGETLVGLNETPRAEQHL